MYNVILRVVAVCLFCLPAFASDISVTGSTSGGMYSMLVMTNDGTLVPYSTFFGQQVMPDPAPVVAAMPNIVSTSSAPAAAPAPITTATSQATSFTVQANAYTSTLSGSLGYDSNSGVWSGGITAATPLVFSNYKNTVPTGDTITGAKLNLGVLLGSPNYSGANVLQFMPALSGNLSNLMVTISGGGITKQIPGTSVSAYDLFANGFGSVITSGGSVSVIVSALDSVNSGMPAMGNGDQPVIINGILYAPGSSFSLMQQGNLSDSRTLTASGGMNFITIYANAPSKAPTPVGPLVDVPEPMTTGLVGLGLALVGYLASRKRK